MGKTEGRLDPLTIKGLIQYGSARRTEKCLQGDGSHPEGRVVSEPIVDMEKSGTEST